MRKKRNSNAKSLAYASVGGPIVEYGTECWDLYREVQVIASDQVQKQANKFGTRTNESVWENLGQRRKIARIWTFGPIQRVHRRTGREGFRGQVRRTMLPKPGRS